MLVEFKIKIGNFIVYPVALRHIGQGNAQMLGRAACGSIQIHDIRRYLPGGVGGQYHFDVWLPLGPGLQTVHHQTAHIEGVRHGFCVTIVEIYLNALLVIVGGGKNKPLFDRGILLHDGIKLSVGNFYTNS
jgi:hypothetical protein